MSSIRVTYSGLIAIVVGISSLLTGTVFTLIVTRSLSPEEFGTWSLVGGLVFYILIFEPIVSYWTTREIARGTNSGGTAVLTSGIFSIPGILAYIVIAYFVGLQVNVNQDVLIFALILIPVMFLNRTLTAICLGWKPQVTSYGLLIFEIIKIPTAVTFVYFLEMGVEGAILATAISYIGSIILLAVYAREKIRDKINLDLIKKWIKVSWIPLFPGISGMIFMFDVTIFSLITGSVIGLAYYSAALAIAAFVAHSGLVSRALYPKFLGGGKKEFLQENLIRFFYFAFALTALSIVLAKPGLFALNPLYEIAVPVVIFLTLRAFLYTLNGIFGQSLQGIEKVDIDEKSKFKDYLKSKLFFIPAIQLIKFSIYIVSLATILIILSPTHSQIDLVYYWSILLLAVEIPFILYMYKLLRKSFMLEIPFRNPLKYLITSIGVFGALYFIMEKYLVYKISIYEFFPQVLLFVVIGIGSYLGITYLIDNNTRTLVQGIISEIKKQKKS